MFFLPYTAGQIAALRDLIATWLRLAIFETMGGGKDDRRLWFIIDELRVALRRVLDGAAHGRFFIFFDRSAS